MRFCIKYADRMLVYVFEGGMQYTTTYAPDAQWDPGGDGVQIDLYETDPAEIAGYRRYARKNWEPYTDVYSAEMHGLVLSHAGGNANAKPEAERLYNMNLKIAELSNANDFETYFAKLEEEFVGADAEDDDADLTRISFDYGGYRMQFVFDDEADRVRKHVIKGRTPARDEFVMDVDETDRAEVARYRRFVGKNMDMYLYMFSEEMRACAETYKHGIRQGKDYAMRLFALNQKFKKAAKPVDFETYFQRQLDILDRQADIGDQSLTRVSFDYGETRSQYVAEKGSDRHENYRIIVDEPPEDGEFIIDLNETLPKVIEGYMEFVAENTELYMDIFAMELSILAGAYLTGNKHSKEHARQLFAMNCKFTDVPESAFEEAFAMQADAVKESIHIPKKTWK